MSLQKKNAVIHASAARERESFIEFFWETVCCWLLAIGTALLQNAQLPCPVSVFSILYQTLATVVILALFSRRWFIMLITTIQLVLCGLLLLVLFRVPVGEFLTGAGDFFAWWMNDLPEDSALFNDTNMLIVHILLNIGISCLMFFVVRVSRGALPPILVCAAISLAVLAFGETDNSAAATAVYMAGCLPLVARDQYSGRFLFSGQEKFRPMGARGSVPTLAGIVCAAAAAGLFFMLPSDTADWRTRGCTELTADIQSAIHLFTSDQRRADSCSLAELGLQPYQNRIGGTLANQPSTVLATTDDDTSRLYKVTSYSYYSGELWQNRFEPAYRVNGPWKKKQTAFLASNALDDPDWSKILRDGGIAKKVTVTLTEERALLPTLGQTVSLTESIETLNPPLFNANGEVLSFYGYPAGFSYTLDTQQYVFQNGAVGDDFALYQLLATRGDDPYFDGGMEEYLQLPDDYPQEARELAEKVAGGYAAPIQRAYLLAKYFSRANGYKYSEKPGHLPLEETVVDNLLETKTGYCVYYATTMATMARSLGIPSRLAAGYRTVLDADTGAFVINSAHPYAWVECYFRNVGWVAFDPTPVIHQGSAAEVPEKEQTEQEEPIPPQKDEEHEVKDPNALWRILLIVLIALLVLVIVLIVLRILLAPAEYHYDRVRQKYRAPAGRLEFYYQDILRQIACLGFGLFPDETADEWISRLEPPLGKERTGAMRAAIRPVMEMHYGNILPNDRQVIAIRQVHDSLEKELRRQMKPLRYLMERRLLLPVSSAAARRYDAFARKNAR